MVSVSHHCISCVMVSVMRFCALQEVPVGSWQLKHAAGDSESVYKFHRNIRIGPQQTITVSAVVNVDLTCVKKQNIKKVNIFPARSCFLVVVAIHKNWSCRINALINVLMH